MKPTSLSLSALLLLTPGLLLADVFYPISSVEVDPGTADLYPVANLIQGAGVGFDLVSPHDSLGGGPTGAWVTTDPAGFPSDYIEDVGMPIIILDLGVDVLLDEVSVWGYSAANSNGVSEFSLRFATEAEGKEGFGTSIGYNPTFTRPFPDDLFRESFEFGEQVTARYVEFLCVDNFWDDQITPGGDRVGLSEIAFQVATSSGGPKILIPGDQQLLNTGSGQTIDISVFNAGDETLTITQIEITGDAAASFTPPGVPVDIATATSANLGIVFDPAGIEGDVTVTVTLHSNDAADPMASLDLTLVQPSFYTIQDVVSTADENFDFLPDLYPSINLIQGPGVGFDDVPPHDKLIGGADGNWVTADDAGFPSDYIEDVTQPVLRLDLGEDVLLAEISVWGYASTNSNGVKDFSLRFATDADGPDGYGTTVSYNPVFNDVLIDGTVRQSFLFGEAVTARYVEFTCLDNFWDNQVTPGGDRVGLGEIAFEIPIVSDDATIDAPLNADLDLDGTVQTFQLPVRNSGVPDLVVSGLTFAGPNAAAFSQVSVPGPVSTFNSGVVEFQFDPAGLAGFIAATLEIASNDPNNSPAEVQLNGLLHDPRIETVDPGVFGPFPPGSGAQTVSVLLGNTGATQTLDITGLTVGGASAGNFSVVEPAPASVDAGGAAMVDLVFDPMGGEGTFAATLTVTTDDPVNGTLDIPLVARVSVAEPLVAFWPLDDAAGSDEAVERVAGRNGVAVSEFITFGEAGARPYSGTSVLFDGIDNSLLVAYDAALNPSSFTVTAWALPLTSLLPHQSVITSRSDFFPDLGGYVLYNAPSGNWEFWSGAGVGAGGWNSVSGGAVTTDEWVHLALVYDEALGRKSIFVNGVEAGSTTVGIAPTGSAGVEPRDLHIGSGADFGDQFYFEGRIDEVAVFQEPLGQAEIQAIIDTGVAANYLDGGGDDGDFRITGFSFDRVTKEVTISYTGAPAGATLGVWRSIGLATWQEAHDDVGPSPFTFTDALAPDDATQIHYRLQASGL